MSERSVEKRDYSDENSKRIIHFNFPQLFKSRIPSFTKKIFLLVVNNFQYLSGWWDNQNITQWIRYKLTGYFLIHATVSIITSEEFQQFLFGRQVVAVSYVRADKFTNYL